MVSIVRGQIADPHLVAKARAGRADEVRPCISCNQLCWGRRSRDYWISCLVNPSAGREFEWGGDRFEPSRESALGPRRRRRAGRAGGGARRGRARPPRDARRARRRVSAASSGSPGSSRRAARSWTCSPGTSGSLAALGVEVRLGEEVSADGRRGRRCRRGHRGDRLAPAGHGLPARAADGRPAPRGGRAPTSCRSTTCWTARPSAGPARPRARRPRRLARARDGAPPGRARPRGDARHRGAGRRAAASSTAPPTARSASATRWPAAAGSRRPPSSAGATASR